ncbi:RHS repeat-associated core domain-containing protein, partial [Tenacibaculum maritimum]|uniref:RHS repeat-associated core domain-containing protein n=1 Tax=Tenacibaculum maritimum TaxID=107401 RepID=UPI003875B954
GNVRLSYTDQDKDGVIRGATSQVFYDSFETINKWDGTGNNFGWGLNAIDSTKKRSGNYSGRIDSNYPSDWERYVNCNSWVEINNATATTYIFSAWVFVEDVANNDAQIFLMMRKSGETGYPRGFSYTTTTERGRWVYLEKAVSVASTVKSLNFRIDNNKAGRVWFDDVRIVKVNNTNEIIEESNYYPFGLKHKGYNNTVSSLGNSTAQKFGYNGKELNDDLVGGSQLNWHDFGARNYDASLGRWMNLDPLAEEFETYSPYNAMMNNPINFIDPDGMAAEWIPEVDENGSVSYIAEKGDTADTFVSQYGKPNGIDKEDAQKLIGVADKDIKAGETAVSGSDVKNLTGSEVLKIDVKSDMATDQRMFDQLLFAVDFSRSGGDNGFRPSDFYSHYKPTGSFAGASAFSWKNVSFDFKGEKNTALQVDVFTYYNDKISNKGISSMGSRYDGRRGVYTSHSKLGVVRDSKTETLGKAVSVTMNTNNIHNMTDRFNKAKLNTVKPQSIKK